MNSLKLLKKIDFLKLGTIVLSFAIALAPLSSFAALPQPACENLNGVSCNAQSANSLITQVINILLGVAFAVAVLFLIIGGFWYITSAGNEETAEKGRNTIINALIGIVVIILAYVIVRVVSGAVSGAGSNAPV